jgi:hypothetical protein
MTRTAIGRNQTKCGRYQLCFGSNRPSELGTNDCLIRYGKFDCESRVEACLNPNYVNRLFSDTP